MTPEQLCFAFHPTARQQEKFERLTQKIQQAVECRRRDAERKLLEAPPATRHVN